MVGADPSVASVDVLGVRIGCTDLPSLLQLADSWISGPVGAVVSYANAHVLNLAAKDGAFRALLGDADLVYPDGMSVVWAARMLGAPPLARTTGVDWIDPLCAMAAARGS